MLVLSLVAILGLTVLALGNCVADWVADTVVTRAGKPEMAFASCFGSPLLSHVLGLSIAMIVSNSIAIARLTIRGRSMDFEKAVGEVHVQGTCRKF